MEKSREVLLGLQNAPCKQPLPIVAVSLLCPAAFSHVPRTANPLYLCPAALSDLAPPEPTFGADSVISLTFLH